MKILSIIIIALLCILLAITGVCVYAIFSDDDDLLYGEDELLYGKDEPIIMGT